MNFEIKKNDKEYILYYNSQKIACGDCDIGFQTMQDIAVHANQEPLIRFHQLAPTEFGHIDEVPEIRCTDNKISLKLNRSNGSMLQKTAVTVTFNPAQNAFDWDFEYKTEFVEAYTITNHFPRTDVDPEYADCGVWGFEVANPMPSKAFAPKDGSVPVDREDILYPQPWYRKNGWGKNWKYFAFTRNDNQTVHIPMNHRDNHDKDFWKQSKNGSLFLLGGDGTNMRYRFLDGTGSNIYHHYCMWGYDLHFIEIIAKGTGENNNPNPVLPAGHVLYHHYTLEALSNEESNHILHNAIEHPWRERDQKRLDNTPVYKPGITSFNNHLGRQDDRGFFQPVTTCQYLPHHPGRTEPGVILIETDDFDFDGRPLYNAWTIGLGSDNWHTPIESDSVYEITVWAKLESNLNENSKARVALQYVEQFNQGKPDFRTERSKVYYSNGISGKTGWTRLVLRTPRLPENYVCTFRIALELHGRGTCYFDEFECRKVGCK